MFLTRTLLVLLAACAPAQSQNYEWGLTEDADYFGRLLQADGSLSSPPETGGIETQPPGKAGKAGKAGKGGKAGGKAGSKEGKAGKKGTVAPTASPAPSVSPVPSGAPSDSPAPTGKAGKAGKGKAGKAGKGKGGKGTVVPTVAPVATSVAPVEVTSVDGSSNFVTWIRSIFGLGGDRRNLRA